MLSASAGYVAAAANGVPPMLRATATLADSTVVELGGDRFMRGGVTLSEATSSSSSFDVGSYVQPTASLSLNNHDGALDGIDLSGADLTIWVGLSVDGEPEWVRRGRYRVERPSTLGTVASLSCVGWASALLSEADWPGSLPFPCTVGDVVSACCSAAGVTLSASAYEGSDATCDVAPPDGSSCLDVLRMAMRVAGLWCREEPDGSITPAWYDPQQAPFSAWANASVDVCVSDVVVTGLRATPASDDDAQAPAMSGEDGYVLDMGTLQMVSDAYAQATVEAIAEHVVGMEFRPFRCVTVGSPLLQAGDAIEVTDQRGNAHASWATSVTWTSGGYETVSCDALTPDRNLRAPGDGVAATVARVASAARAAASAASAAGEAASAAQAVAMALGQHFWTDDAGVHVTEALQSDFEEQAQGPNLLANAMGILLRTALMNLVSVTPGAVAFFDGTGNGDDNVIAVIGPNAIGNERAFHLVANQEELGLYDGSERAAWVSDMRLFATLLSVLSSLRIGIDGGDCWEWLLHDNGNLELRVVS